MSYYDITLLQNVSAQVQKENQVNRGLVFPNTVYLEYNGIKNIKPGKGYHINCIKPQLMSVYIVERKFTFFVRGEDPN